jgi:hypothetical protein
MTTESDVRIAVRARIEGGNIVDAGGDPVPLRWQNEFKDSNGKVDLPDKPAAFIYTEFTAGRANGPAGFGGGAGRNLYRNPCSVVAYVFVPRGKGLDDAEAIAEQVAVLFRSFRTGDVTFLDASVYPGGDGALLKPPGLESEVGNYFWACCEANGFFNLIG